jgi:hypothetical protein
MKERRRRRRRRRKRSSRMKLSEVLGTPTSRLDWSCGRGPWRRAISHGAMGPPAVFAVPFWPILAVGKYQKLFFFFFHILGRRLCLNMSRNPPK